jgi:hypothetical protein
MNDYDADNKNLPSDSSAKNESILDRLLIEGLDSGEPLPLNDEDWEAMRNEVLSRLK